jgi:hypothetical protein
MSDREIINAKRGFPPEDAVKRDKYVQAVKEKFEQRSQIGIKKYNTTLEREDLSFLDWLEHLQQELMDATLYVERLKTSYVEETQGEGQGDLGE